MASAQRTPHIEPQADQFVLSRCGARGLEVCDLSEDEPFSLVRFDALYRRATFDGHVVRRRRFYTSDLLLIDPREGPVAVALKEGWALGLRYRLEWDGGELVLMGARTTYMWEVFANDEVVGALRAIPFTNGDRQVSLPPGTPDAIVCFVVAVTELARHHPALRLIDRAIRPLPWP